MRWWETSVGGPARGRIIGLLRRESRSVEELAAALRVTDNAVRAHLAALERAGLVRAAGVRRTGGVGKPATMYEIVPDAEPLFSSAYVPVLRALLESLEGRLSGPALDAVFRDVGRRLAAEHAADTNAPTSRNLETRVRAAAAVLTSLGGETKVERTPDGYVIRGCSCPLSSAVQAESRVCHAVEELVSAVAGVRARERCEREGHAHCCFEFKRSA